WTTSNPAIATVSPLSASTASVSGTGAGTATITATPTRGPSTTATVTVTPGQTILYDSFRGVEGTLVTAHAPEVNQIGGPWVVSGAPAPALRGEQAGVTIAAGIVTAVIDGGTPDVTVGVGWTPGANPAGGANYGGLVFRQSDANN